MSIRTLTPPNLDDDPAVFDAAAYTFSQDLNGWASDVAAVGAAMTLNATNDTSASSNAIGTGAKTFTVSAGKSFLGGMFLVLADAAAPSTNWMLGQVTSYSGTTLVVNALYIGGSGTKTSWLISQCAYLPATVGDHEVTVHTGNGHGSTNTKIRRFTTTARNVGTAITYTDSATLGGSFTVNESGLFEIYYSDVHSVAVQRYFGASVNSAALTTSVQAITDLTIRVMLTSTPIAAAAPSVVTRTVRLTAGDVVRAHTDGSIDGTAVVLFSIRKVGI